MIKPLFTLSAALLASTASWAITINGKTTGLQNGQKVYLYSTITGLNTQVAETTVADAKFTLVTKGKLPKGIYNLGTEPRKTAPVVIGDKDLDLEFQPAPIPKATVSGDAENASFVQFRQLGDDLATRVNALEQRGQQAEGTRAQNEAAYGDVINKIRLEYDSLMRAYNTSLKTFGAENKATLAGMFAAGLAYTDGEGKDAYFKEIDFTQEPLATGNFINDKFQRYLQRYVTTNDLKAFESEADALLATAPKHTPGRVRMYEAIVQFFLQYDQDYSRAKAKAFNDEYPKLEASKTMLAQMPKAGPVIGEEAPDIKLANRDGKMESLSNLKGKVVLIDFWASWCGPCRQENPNVVKAYNKYKDKGFTIFSVSLDNTKDKWLTAIEKDGLAWNNHVSDLKGWSSAGAAAYDVRSIPATFLIDKKGKIIAKNLRGKELEDMLEKVLQ